jgi:hypothetical protein
MELPRTTANFSCVARACSQTLSRKIGTTICAVETPTGKLMVPELILFVGGIEEVVVLSVCMKWT